MYLKVLVFFFAKYEVHVLLTSSPWNVGMTRCGEIVRSRYESSRSVAGFCHASWLIFAVAPVALAKQLGGWLLMFFC